MSYVGDDHASSRGPGAVAARDAVRPPDRRASAARSRRRDVVLTQLANGPSPAERRALAAGRMRLPMDGVALGAGPAPRPRAPGSATRRPITTQAGSTTRTSTPLRDRSQVYMPVRTSTSMPPPGGGKVPGGSGGGGTTYLPPTPPPTSDGGATGMPPPSTGPGSAERPNLPRPRGRIPSDVPIVPRPPVATDPSSSTGHSASKPNTGSGGGGGGGGVYIPPTGSQPRPDMIPVDEQPPIDVPSGVGGKGFTITPTVLAVGAAAAVGVILLIARRKGA